MGLIEKLLGLLFGNGRNVLRETAEVFLENSENSSARDAAFRSSALEQFAREFAVERKGGFDRFMDGLNRVPRPLMAFGTIGLCVAAMVDPVWFAARMQGIALVPEPLWWLLGAIVSFYFGARYQFKSQDFQQSIAATMNQASMVTANIAALNALAAGSSGLSPVAMGAGQDNPALAAWRQIHDE